MNTVPVHPNFLSAEEYNSLVQSVDEYLISHPVSQSKALGYLRDHLMNETFRRLDEDPATEGNMIPVPDDLHGEECAAFLMDIWMVLLPMIRPLPRYQKQAAVLRLMLVQLLANLRCQASIPGAELSTMRTAETLRERRIAEEGIEP